MTYHNVSDFRPIPGPYTVHYWTPGHLPHRTANGLYHDLLHFSAPEAPWCFQISVSLSESPPVHRPIAALRVPCLDGLDEIEATTRLLAAAPALLAALLTLLRFYEAQKTEINDESSPLYGWLQPFSEVETAIRTMLPPGFDIAQLIAGVHSEK